jgi:hypothetical protein
VWCSSQLEGARCSAHADYMHALPAGSTTRSGATGTTAGVCVYSNCRATQVHEQTHHCTCHRHAATACREVQALGTQLEAAAGCYSKCGCLGLQKTTVCVL